MLLPDFLGYRPQHIALAVSAAPHLPAGILSPYSDGERGAIIDGFANCERCRKSAKAAAIHLLPVTIRGEGAGRRMRGGANASCIGSTTVPKAEGHS
ncbi:hypothetical protein EN750_29545 [Mesorhizobium sp. M7A.F.Ca.ET.027.03.2.1]|nr:hypothetical protein EN750_29545 [Mesorhizobium sp. M7A.F.Ca.ET.027.03.2.1]